MLYNCRRGKDYSRPVGFVSAGVQEATQGEEEGGSESEDEVGLTQPNSQCTTLGVSTGVSHGPVSEGSDGAERAACDGEGRREGWRGEVPTGRAG